MRYEIREHDANVEIEVRDAGARMPHLLKSMQDCKSGQCECPTDQYDRLAAMTVSIGDDRVIVRLTPRLGERLDPEQLRVCLDYTVGAEADSSD